MQKFLSISQRSALKSAHKIERDRKIGDRMKVVLLADQGESLAEIAKFLFIDEQTARRHLKDYFDNDKLEGSSGGSEGKLSPEQAVQLRAILGASDVPGAKFVVQKVKDLFGLTFSVSGMTDWLKRNDFSFKKSEPAPAKADPQAQLEFIDTYRTLKDNLPEGEVLLFLDAAHPTMATKLGYGWSARGERKIVATTAGKARVNVLGSLEPATMKRGHHVPRNSQLADPGRALRKASQKLSEKQIFYAQHYSGPRLLLREQGHASTGYTPEHQALASATLFAQSQPDRAGLEGDERGGTRQCLFP